MIRRICLIIFFAAVIGGINFLINPNKPQHAEGLTFTQVAKLSTPVLFVDARKAVDFSLGHVAGAVNLPDDDFDAHVGAFLDRWVPEASVVVYCANSGCNSSASVARRLREDFQIKTVYVLKDDWQLWERYLK